MASVQELVTVGEKMGLKGEGLQAFVEEQQTLAKEAATEKLDRERGESKRA
jgi:hypothetical protein